MPVFQNINSLKFFNQARNGDDFSQNPSEFSENFTGNVGELVKAVYQVELSWYEAAGYTELWDIFTGYITKLTGNFNEFKVGQTFEFYPNFANRASASPEFVATVDSITQNGQRLDFTVNSGSQVTTGYGDYEAGIWAQADLSANCPDAAVLKFDLAPNGSNPMYRAAWIATSIDLTGVATSVMSWSGQFQDKKTGSATIKQDSFVSANNSVIYEVEHVFRVTPFYKTSYLADLQAGTKPADYAQNLNYFFEIEFKYGLNDTRSIKVLSPSNLPGLSSWFDDSIGGYFNRYSAANIAYEDTASATSETGLQTALKTTLSFDIDKAAITGSAAGFSTGDEVRIFVAYLPDQQSDYTDTVTDFDSNFLFDSLEHESGTAATTGAGIIKRCLATVSGGTMSVEIDVEYSSIQQVQIGNNAKYLVFAQVADTSLTVNNSDRTTLIIDLGDYVKEEFITGLASFTKFDFLTYEQDFGIDAGTGTAGSKAAWNEDGLLLDYTLQLDTNNNAVIESLTFALVAQKTADSSYFILDSYNVDLSNAVLQSGVQQIDIDTTRGYKLPSGNAFNFVKLENDASGAGTEDYAGATGVKIPWKDYIFNPNVDPVFYDNAEENNNLNFKASNYSNLSGYEVRILAIVETAGLDTNGLAASGRDLQFSGAIDTYNYGVSDDGSFGGTIVRLDPDTMTDLGGKILANKNTLFRVDWTHSNNSISNVYAIHRIQVKNALGDDIEELGTRFDPPGSQILIPKDGETRLTIDSVAGGMRSECLIDYTKISIFKQYTLSARIERFTVAPNFSVSVSGCDLELVNTFAGSGITDIQYTIRIGATVIEVVNTLLTTYVWHPAALYNGESLSIEQDITYSGGNEISSQAVAVSVATTCYVEFTSNAAAVDTFSPQVNTSGAAPYWRMPDNSFVNAASVSELGSGVGFDGTDKTIRLTPNATFTELDNLQMQGDRIKGTLNLSSMDDIGPSLDLSNNADLTGLTVPSSSQVFTKFHAFDTGLTGTLTLSGLTGLGGDFRVYSCSNLTAITLPTTSEIFTFFYFYLNDITGTLDLSSLTELGGDLIGHNNPNLTAITNPTSSQVFTRYAVYNCNLTGTLDLSGLTGLGGQIAAYDNANLTAVTLPTTSQVFSLVNFRNCDLTGTLNLSSLTGMGGSIQLNGNANLTAITFPTSSQAVTTMNLYGCNLTSIDFSSLSNMSGTIQVYSNANLTTITNPASSGTISTYFAYSCDLGYVDITTLTFSSSAQINFNSNNMTAAEVNHILVDLDATLPGTGTGTINIEGTNAAPDGTSGGYDGLTAKSNLVSKGYTVTTN